MIIMLSTIFNQQGSQHLNIYTNFFKGTKFYLLDFELSSQQSKLLGEKATSNYTGKFMYI